MGLRPVVKAKNSRQKVASWIVEKFPENYREVCYLEPFLGDGSVLLAKDKSAEEVASDSDGPLMSVWRAIRDEPSLFSSSVKRMNHSRSTFDRASKATGGDYMDEAVREFALRQMSRGAEKSVYLCQAKELKCGDCWCGIFDRIPEVHERVRSVYMVNMDAIKVTRAFDHDGCLVFCDPPALEADNSDFHAEMGEIMAGFRGRAAVVARNTAMYKRIYKEWNRKSLPGGGNESLWTNF